MTANLSDSAVALARAGWKVHPLVGKQPLLPHGLKGASGDPATVAGWWARWPRANIGVVVPDSLVVLDFDPRAGAWETLEALEAEHGHLPPTLAVRTGGADRGEHRYYLRPPGRVAMAKLGAGIDLRLPGRHYLVAPPSRHPETGRAYEWLDASVPPAPVPPWLAPCSALRDPLRSPGRR
jgi:hypothetical protein